jgi:exosortase/archaeosortase family protein
MFKLYYNQIPKPLRIFLVRGLIILILWKLIYILFLKPDHRLDEMLTYFVGSTTAWIFSHIYPSMQPLVELADTNLFITIVKNNVRIDSIAIADACNGLELMILYLGFILAAPYPTKKKIHFIYVGLLLIVFTNVIRCLLLIFVFLNYPNYFGFAHHYIFTFVIYLIIFLIWIRFIKAWIKYENSKI